LRRRILVRVREHWWLFRIERHELDAAIARTCGMARASCTIDDDRVLLQLTHVELTMHIRARGPHQFELRFAGPWRAHRKALLVRSLLAKQFEPLLPRIRIRLRRAGADVR
jgi:hypothetical protein